MKLLFAAISLWAVAVLAMRGERRYRDDIRVDPREVQAFRPGQTYRYRLDTQISSGMASVSDQHAVTRLQADVLIQFHSDRLVSLKLDEVRMGSINHEIPEPERVQPMEMFNKKQLKSEEENLLELPCNFDYVDGLVERIRFHREDKHWSKNIKRSVLNMLQLNLKQRQGHKTELKPSPEWERELEYIRKSDSEVKMFVMPEITLEGECQTVYTVNKMNPREKFNREETSDDLKVFNVTKSIDFKQCKKIADIRYGPQVEKPCDNCTTGTTPEELEERKLDRTTVLRHVVVGNTEKYGIHKVELVSHYMFKMLNVEEEKPIHTIVAGELNYMNVENGREREEMRTPLTTDKDETLLYSTEWDEQEKLFYMYGDDEFPQDSPFKTISDKVGKVHNQMSKLLNMWSDKSVGIEPEATQTFYRMVELLRMCSRRELEEIYSRYNRESSESRHSESDKLKAKEIIIDALTNAGTHNPIKLLVEKIIKGDIEPSRAVRVLIQLKNLPAPSDKQVDTLVHLCQHQVCNTHEPCRQVCWLTSGAIMGELCNEELTVEDAFEQKKEDICHADKKKKFIKTVLSRYEKVETRYEKILLLKTLGNARLDLSVFDLEKIIKDIREDPIVRMQAIDSLRRLRATMPEKIQRVLMPIFQNVRERPELRMACISQILATIPKQSVLDQIGLTLIRDPSRQVKSYVYTAMKVLSKSPVHIEKELAQHLNALLKMASITEEDEEDLLRGSRYYRIPVYSQAKKEGFFMDFESMIGTDNVLPKHISAGVDKLFNGIFEKNSFEVSFTQEDLERWYEQIFNAYMEYSYSSDYSSSKKSLRGYRSSERSSDADTEIRSIFSGLGIKRRQRVDSDSSDSNNSPYGMLCFRYGDIDYAVVPLEEELLPSSLKKLVINGERLNIREITEYIQGKHFRFHGGMNMFESMIKIPTSMGLPIRMLHILPVLASVEGEIKPRFGQETSVEVKIHPMLSATHLKRLEIWSPLINTGVETSRTLGFNLPITSKVTIQKEAPHFKWTIQVPENKFTAFTFQSLPLTFVSEQDWMTPRNPVIKRIENQQLVHRAQHVEKTYGEHNFNLPLKVVGEIHVPHRWTYEDIVNTLMTSENHLVVEFRPHGESPREIELTAEGKFFQPNSERERYTQHRESFKSFYSKSNFDEEADQYYDSNDDDERQLTKILNDYEPRKMYNHFCKVQLKTLGGRKQKSAHVELDASCDDKLRYCQAKLNVKRSPLFEESREWTLKTEAQILMPERLSSYEQYEDRRSTKEQKLVSTIECEWGADQKQVLSININGEQARNRYWSEKINEIEKYNRIDMPKLREQLKRKVAFLNKYDISAQYRHLQPSTWNFLNWCSTTLKSWNFWNTKTELKSRATGQEGQFLATVVIDPFTHEHVNVTMKTPTEIVRISSLPLPMKVKPFKLVSSSGSKYSSMESFTDLISSYTSESRPECTVDSRKVRTFDDVSFKAPITKCYSVLAKDCSRESPRFAVLMKKVSSDEENNKKLKFITNEDVIEIEPESRNKLVVKINGQRKDCERNDDECREYGIKHEVDQVRIHTKDCSVIFDGEKAKVQISPFYKNKQCGLCGHYDDDTEDEYRTSNNELTDDLKTFHKSYSLQDDECRSDLEETHGREEYKPIWDSRETYEREEEYEERRRRINDDFETEPIEKTEVMEYNHKICFSVKPVKSCPEGSYPSKTKEQKVSFTCMDRTSSEARRLLRQARRYNEMVELPSQKASFVQPMTVPTTCEVY